MNVNPELPQTDCIVVYEELFEDYTEVLEQGWWCSMLFLLLFCRL